MKKTAKLLAALLAMLLTFCAIPAFGANTGLPPDTGSLTIHKYIMANLDYAKVPNDGTEISSTDLEDPTKFPASAVPKEGIYFDAYLLTGIIYKDGTGEHTLPIRDNQNGNTNNTGNVITTPLGNEAMYAILDDFDKFTFSLNDYDNPTKIDLLTGFEVKDDNYLGGVRTIIGFELGTVAGTSKFAFPATNAAGVATVNNMPKGFYLVREQITGSNPTDVASVVFPFIVAVPMTNADGDGWIQDVHVYPKNGDISIHKYIDRNAVHLGEKVMMDVVVSIPADIRTYGQFDMTDVLDACLTYVPGSLKVYGYKGVDVDPDPVDSLLSDYTDGSVPGRWELFASTGGEPGTTNTIWIMPPSPSFPTWGDELPYFTVTEPVITGTNTLTVVANTQLRPSPVTSRGQTLEFWKLREYNFIRYQFEVIVNAALLDHNTLTHPSYVFDNEAKITFKNKFDTQVGRDRNRTSNKVRAHSAAILMDKIDANNNNVLEGAQFKIASSEANARAGDFLRQIKDGSGKVLGILDVGQSVTIGGTTYFYSATTAGYTGATGQVALTAAADWVEAAQKPSSSDAGLYPGTGIWSYVQNKAIVRFEGLKEFGTTHTNGVGRKDSTGSIAGDLEDQRKNSRLDNNISYSKGLSPDGGPSNAYLSYWIVETKTPTGYNLLLEPIKVTFSQTNSNYSNWYTIGSSETDAIRIRNSNKFTLPRTGGIGTILFTAGGAALICVAVFLFLVSRKKKKEQAN